MNDNNAKKMFLTYISFDVTQRKNVDGCILRGKYFLREKEADCVNELVLEKSYITKKVLIMRLAK